jgi:hypothetical protein
MGRELTTGVTTKTDMATREWSLTDDVVRLREWATERTRPLPPPSRVGCLVGTSESCVIRLEDLHVSREHARLFHDSAAWWIRDLGSKNKIRENGVQVDEFQLRPLTEIGIGGVTFIAESGRSIALRGYLRRILGWASDQTAKVDLALRAMRLGAARRSPLTLCGDGDLVPLAFSLHRHSLPADRPFVLCDPDRNDGGESVRSVANRRSGVAALEAARGGTLCIRASRRPSDFAAMLGRFEDPHAGVQLILCSTASSDGERAGRLSILVPALKDRAQEIARIVDEYAEDARAAFSAPPSSFVRSDRAWVLANEASTLPEIETATRRLVALRSSENAERAAERLGMTGTSLRNWIGRRKLPQHVEVRQR